MKWTILIIVIALLAFNKYMSKINEELRKMDDDEDD